MSTTSKPPRVVRLPSTAPPRLTALLAGAVAAVLIALWAWPVGGLIPVAGPDPSWVVGLQLIFRAGYDYGSEVIFTYGPLGFLHVPVAVDPTALRLSLAFLAVLEVALAGTLLWSLHKAFRSWWIAAPLAYVAATVIGSEATLVLGFTAAIALIAGLPKTPRATVLVACALGVLAGIEVLGKVNVGVGLVLLAAVAAVASPAPRRTAPALAGAFIVTAAAAWIVTGQSLTAIPSYISGALAISAGYGSAMVYESFDAFWPLPAMLAIGALGAAVALRSGLGLPQRSRAGLLVAWVVLWFVAFKSSVVRQDVGHGMIFAQDTLGALTAFGWAVRRRALALLVGLAPLAVYFGLTSVDVKTLLSPRPRLAAASHQAGVATSAPRMAAEIAAARQSIRVGTPLDGETEAALRGKRITVEPHAISIAFAYNLAWKPLPVIQGYAAYTPKLDARNADAFASPQGPPTVLRQTGDYAAAIDGRWVGWDPPAAMRAMLCHFRQTGGPSGVWQVLERVPDRCGRPHEIARVKARLGEPVTVPAAPPGELLYVEVDGFGLTPFERLRTLLYRARARTVVVNGARPFPLPPATAGDGLLLRVPQGADFTQAGFALDLAPQTLTFEGGGSQDLTLRFVAQPIS